MLERYFRPETVDRFLASWLGAAIDKYVEWLGQQGYARSVVLKRVPRLIEFGDFARARGATKLEELAAFKDVYVARWVRRHSGRCRDERALQLVRSEAHAPVQQLVRLLDSPADRHAHCEPWPFRDWAPGYREHLTRERGLSPQTILSHRHYLTRFERYLRRQRVPDLARLSAPLLSGFMMEDAKRLSLGSLYGRCSTVRAFLRYCYRERLCPADLSRVPESPWSYRLAGLPRSISNSEVARVLAMVDRRKPVGKRDYAMLLLLVTYGLRAREVAALTFDDLDWAHDRLRVPKRKAGHSTVFPFSSIVGAALIDYIRNARPPSSARRVFLGVVAPFRPIEFYTVADRAGRALRHAGIGVRRPGSHTFRHTCVQQLVDAEFPFKVIGDYVGHRSPDSTRVYSKVAIEALRAVAMGDGEEVL